MLAVLGALVHCFDGLKRQGDPHGALLLAILVFAFPGKFGHRLWGLHSLAVRPARPYHTAKWGVIAVQLRGCD